MELKIKGKTTHLNLSVTCHPFQYERHDLILLILEGVDEPTKSENCSCAAN
jgi:hypothetical protein